MAEVSFTRNEFEPLHGALAEQFETELAQALSAIPGTALAVQVRVDTTPDGALERAWIVVASPDWVREWPLQLPVAEGDVRRSAVRNFTERRAVERREGHRAGRERRGQPAA